MPKIKKSDKKEKSNNIERLDLHPDTKKSVVGILLFAAALVLILSHPIFNLGGKIGSIIFNGLDALLGYGFFLVPFVLIVLSFVFFFSERQYRVYFFTSFSALIFLLSFLGIIEMVISRQAQGEIERHSGGYLGFLASYPLNSLFGFWAALILLLAAIFASFLVMVNLPVKNIFKIATFFISSKKEENEEILEEAEEFDKKEKDLKVDLEKNKIEIEKLQQKVLSDKKSEKEDRSKTHSADSRDAKYDIFLNKDNITASYKLPSLDLLESDKGAPVVGDIRAYANIIKRTLENFGIDVEMGEVNIGPTVTQYTLKPAQGVKLSKITALQNDLALSLAAHPIRIEAPIPGRPLVGIEVPNRTVAMVRLRNLLDNSQFKNASPLSFVLGRDVAGNPVYVDIEKMPHLLIAGSTGSGKSVSIHSMLISLLVKNYPQILRLMIIDPKRVELSAYRGIPHLLAPIIIEREKAVNALRWAVKEMEKRYETLSEYGVRDINSYNNLIIKNKGKSMDSSFMPFILIFIDELADLMSAYPRETEASIIRLAQMSRAVGIHLIISTQRPSVEVLTGLIKANITSRIAFQVATQVDSRTILDMSGAEKLLGSGDLLYLAGDSSKPKRVQGAFVSEKEVGKITEYLKDAGFSDTHEAGLEDELSNPMAQGNGFNEGVIDDELFEEAKKIIMEAGRASTSLLQRRLRIGYSRAARLIDMLEESGVVGPAEGSKPRQVLIKEDKFEL